MEFDEITCPVTFDPKTTAKGYFSSCATKLPKKEKHPIIFIIRCLLERKTKTEPAYLLIDYQLIPKELTFCTTNRPLLKHCDLQGVAFAIPTEQN